MLLCVERYVAQVKDAKRAIAIATKALRHKEKKSNVTTTK
jgi:hypothetical protein